MPVSPIKPSAPAATREALTANMIEYGLVKELSVAAFTGAFFKNELPKDEFKEYVPPGSRKTITTITQSNEQEAYEPVGKLLNGICDAYAAKNHIAEDEQLAFAVHANHSPANHPHSYTNHVATQKPDLVLTKRCLAILFLADEKIWSAFSDSKKSRVGKPAIAWHHILSLIEGKGFKDTSAHFQCATYLGSLMQARPHLIGCLGLAIAPGYFRLLWGDVSGVYYTNEISWTSRSALSILVEYVHQVHTSLVDPSITLRSPEVRHDQLRTEEWRQKSYASPPVWYVKDADRTVYVVEKVLSVGDAWSRKNWVAEARHTLAADGSHKPLEPPIVIKDSFQRPERAAVSTEGDILRHIHRSGNVPGVMTPISEYHVRLGGQPVGNFPLPPGMDDRLRFATRVRYRLFLTWYANDQLYSACPSVQDFLEVMYDLLEVLKYLHEEHGVTHRDVSPFNVLRQDCELVTPPQPIPPSTRGKSDPAFINQFLSDQDAEPPANTPKCILIDFDNAFWDGKASDALRTATPGFLARTLSLGRVKNKGPSPPPIPTLEDEALEAYLRVYGQARYDFASALHDNIVNGPDIPKTATIPHLPHHDAEACFWVIVWHLILALPKVASCPDNVHPMSHYFHNFEVHRIRDIAPSDGRAQCFEFDDTAWESILHPDLKSLAPFLRKLAEAVAPEYSRWPGQPLDDYHLHEAMQRLVLQEIWRLKKAGDPLNVDTQCQRVPTSRNKAETGLAATAPRVHASRKARGDGNSTNKSSQARSAKRTREASPQPDAPSGSTSAPAGDKQKKRKTAKDPRPPSRTSERQRKKRDAPAAPGN